MHRGRWIRFTALLALLPLWSSPAAAELSTARYLVAQLAAPVPASPGTSALRHVAPRLAMLGLSVQHTLLDGIGPQDALGRSLARPTLPREFGFEPSRIVLLEAPDSALAAHARRALAADASVDWVEPLVVRELQMVSLSAAPATPARALPFPLDSLPDDPHLRDTRQYGLWNAGPGSVDGGVLRADVHALEAWRVTSGDERVRIAVADTGIDPAQPELGGLLVGGGPRIVEARNVTLEPHPAVTDSFGHGTPVAGVMSARTDDGPHFAGGGVAGLAGGDGATTAGCALVPIKIAAGHSGYATSWDIARAAIHAADVGARAMNLSFAGNGESRLERSALTYALLQGCVVVAASGNRGTSAPTRAQYPAAYAAEGLVIQVGASTAYDERAVFSSYGPGLDLVAPGLGIWTTFMSYPSWAGASYPGYVAASGTSFAAPFVTAAVGLLASVRPELIDTDFQHVLRETADDLPPAGPDAQTGWERLNVARALHAVRPEVGIWHDEVVADRIEEDATGALDVGEGTLGTLTLHLGERPATRIAAYATVTVPDSLVDSLRVWPRVGGTFAVRGDFRLPYYTPSAEVVAQQGRTFTLRGYLYRITRDSCDTCDDLYVPLAPSNVRFGFTVIGRADRGGGGSTGAPPVTPPFTFTAHPNPFRGALTVRLPRAAQVRVLDAQGRLVREWDAVSGETSWDGRDMHGREVRPGLLLLQVRDHDGRAQVRRVMRLP